MRAPNRSGAVRLIAALTLISGPSGADSATPNGSEFQVNTYTTNYQGQPSVASDSDGNFVVVWASGGSAGSDTSGSSIQGQRFDSNGVAIGSGAWPRERRIGDSVSPMIRVTESSHRI